MSGMFYSLEEAAEKLSKSKDEVKKLIKDGTLREFRDGPNILFKIDEVDALIQNEDVSGLSDEAPLEIHDDTEILELAPEESESEVVEEMDIPEFTSEEPEPEAVEEEPLTLEPEQEAAKIPEDEFIDFNADTAITEIPEENSESEEISAQDSLSDIMLAPETGAPADINDLTDGDTALVGQGTSILGLSDNKEYDVTDDTMADTVILDGTKAGSTGLGNLDDEVSLDNLGSGSGLLDLSLQADDTSLGGILDEIYTEESKEPGLSEPKEPELDAGMPAEPEALSPQFADGPAIALGVGAAEVQPDSQSNTLGLLLFVPIVAVLYGAIVTLGGLRGILPSILTTVQDFIWFIMGGLAAITAIIAAAAFMLTGEKKSPVAKEKKVKEKKEKAPKVKKEKAPKPKKEKPPKPDKKAKKK